MRNSLLIKLLGTFILVIAIDAMVTYWMTSQSTQNAFSVYSSRSGQTWAQRLAPVLADYFTQNGSWVGVETLIQSDIVGTGVGITHPMGNGGGAGQGMGLGRLFAGGGMGQRIILADQKGYIVFDTRGVPDGKLLSSADLSNGTAITVANDRVGTVIVTPNDFATPGTPAGEFLSSVNQSILISAGIAGALALLLGAVLFIQITAPLRQLKNVAHAIAGGDLSRRVTIQSHDELGDLGRTFNHMADNLVRAETQRHNLVADVAHELRTPLAVIRANLEGIRDDVLPMDLQHINAVYSETLLLNRLVDDLRLLSLAEAGELKMECSWIDPEQMINQVLERMTPQARQKNIHFESEIQEDLPKIWGDTDRLTQVLNNLLTNAMRYTHEHGTIRLSAAILPNEVDMIKIAITDTGSGIEPEILPYVFDRFYRADKSRTRSSGGSGLGLAIVKQLVEAHGGMVAAESPVFHDENQRSYGTKILFTLPIIKITKE